MHYPDTTTQFNCDVTDNDSYAPDYDEVLSVVAFSQPAGGEVTQYSPEQLTFEPTPGVFGPTTFTYTISDGNGKTATATVHLAVELGMSPLLIYCD